MQRNYRKEIVAKIVRGQAVPHPRTQLMPAIANLLTKGRIKYGVTGSVRVRVSIIIKYILYFIHILHFIHLQSVGGATVRRTGPSTNLFNN